jgi:ferric-dicitrate binding protein FerR (iron transport regulator)
LENYEYDMMDELLVKYLAEEATPPEQEVVEVWIGASDTNRRYFRHFQLIWNESQKLATRTSVDENKAWQRFQRKVKRSATAGNSLTRFGWWRVAAVIIFIAGIAWLLSSLLETGSAEPPIVNIVSVNEVKKDTLPDGSFATLNKNSKLTYRAAFKGQARKVQLKGEAFFSVKPDKQKPFIIDVNDVQVKVVGTSFNVKSLRGATEIIVETGIVQVTKADTTIELKAGQRILFETVDTSAQIVDSNDKLYNYYVSRTFECDNTPLWKLVEKLNEAYDVNIRIRRDELKKLPLSVTFDDESLDVILDVISQTLMIKISRKENEIILE